MYLDLVKLRYSTEYLFDPTDQGLFALRILLGGYVILARHPHLHIFAARLPAQSTRPDEAARISIKVKQRFLQQPRMEAAQHRVYERLIRFRRRFQEASDDSRAQLLPGSQVDPDLVVKPRLVAQHATYSTSPQQIERASDFRAVSTTTGDDKARVRDDQSAHHASDPEQTSYERSALGDDFKTGVVSSDIWSAAFSEAIERLGDDIDVAILNGKSVEQLFRELEEIDTEATQESAFVRGLKYLNSIQVPLERFKLALDLASPLTSLEPTVTTVFGVVRSVTVIAISLASADLEFAKQIGAMLEEISYIDDCDALGQKGNKKDIHKKILEFYQAAFEILTRKRAKLVMKMVLEKHRLPDIVQDFLRHADFLRKLVQKATWEIVEDIKSMLYDRESSDKMSRQSRYHAELRDLRADEACKFLLTDTNFIRWYRDGDSRQMVILGDMGCGKTVAMAFLVDELSRRNECQLPQPKICYYYCRDDASNQAINMYSVLILALLEQLSGLKKTFYEWYRSNQASGNVEPATDKEKLQEFLERVLDSLDRPLFIVIDALDECDRDSRNRVIKLLKTLLHKNPRLKILLSSRSEEEILEQLDKTVRVDLVSNVGRDGVIVEHTVQKRLAYLSRDVKALVIRELSRLAQGSAIWTKMLIELIEVRGIRALDPMRQFLERMPLPNQLSELYSSLLSRCTSNDPENRELAIIALKLLAVTRRPLSILELAWAVALAAARQNVTTVAALAKLIDHQRVLALIHPFITRIDFGDVTKRQVRLVHQSVKDYIQKEHTLNQPRLQGSVFGMADDEALAGDASQHLEACILDVSIRYLLLDDVGHVNFFSDEQMAINELPQEVDLFIDDGKPVDYDPCCTWEEWEENMIRYDPFERGFGGFFVYASRHWLDHFGAIKFGPLPTLESIENLCQAGSTRLHNWTQQNCRPDCVIKSRFKFDSRLYDPLSITSLYGSEPMLRYMLENSTFDKDKFLSQPVTGAADQILQWGDSARLRILLLEGKLRGPLQDMEIFRLILRQWCGSATSHHDWNLVFDLIDHVLDSLIWDPWANELLCMAARAGCMPMIQHLMIRAQQKGDLKHELLRGDRGKQQLQSFRKPVHQSIGEAVLGNHINVVKYLLRQEGIETHLQYLNLHGENVLHLASGLCNPGMFRLLVPCFQEGIHQKDDQGNTVLMRIIMSSSGSHERHECARTLLLQSDANGNSYVGYEQHHPLRMAVQLEDFDMCFLLIHNGKMNPLFALKRDHDDELVLKDEILGNEENMAAILQLLREGANAVSTSDA
ncbi:MAG: hypothetical protein M1831_007250 [Alyxoria varia]|nr:MAG: hypothetical protein M1831_007250 [Alyxoria varia]